MGVEREFQVQGYDFQIAKVVGESDEGMTLFIPKVREGRFKITKGDRFYTLVFLKDIGNGDVRPFTPWEE